MDSADPGDVPSADLACATARAPGALAADPVDEHRHESDGRAVVGAGYAVVHVGDSRLYRLRGGDDVLRDVLTGPDTASPTPGPPSG
ncbi:hypothetical protein [Pseudonocardia sp. KRD291]|uniref:hypothetical protein n=1 Tax=Pseudonocardia sp. KRD291 TaxID=2792007 RepID=UPI001C4A725F|nr:hypothetical protein [Pseudonocardia sp. KRD291]MBW0104107.1 hypothetical protein [Pseudonocardia sp. KRD291]